VDGSHGFIKGDHSSPANQTSLHSDRVTKKMGSWRLTEPLVRSLCLIQCALIATEIWVEGCLEWEERNVIEAGQEVCVSANRIERAKVLSYMGLRNEYEHNMY